MGKIIYFGVCFFLAASFIAGCGEINQSTDQNQTSETEEKPEDKGADNGKNPLKPAENNQPEQDQREENKPEAQPSPSAGNEDAIKVVSQPASMSGYSVNKQYNTVRRNIHQVIWLRLRFRLSLQQQQKNGK